MKPMYVLAAIVLLIAAGIAVWTGVSKPSSGMATTTGQVYDSTAMTSRGSLAQLVAQGGSWECDVNHTSENDTTTGNVFIAGSKVRGDFNSVVPQMGSVEAHMISDGIDVYVWTSMMKTGFKTKATAANEGGTSTSGSADFYNQNYDYDCKPWQEDSGKFTLPQGITFSDTAAMTAPTGTVDMQGDGSLGANCAMCDQIPDASSKAQCKSALHCK